jgi:acyl-CoA thioester hydrolase
MTPPEEPAPVAADYPHHHRVPTRWNDNDVFGHLNNTVYYVVMDTVITSWLVERGGLAVVDPVVRPVVASSSCEYRRSGAYPDALDVGLRAARVGSTSVTWELGLFRERDGALLAEGRWTHVFLDPGTSRPVPLPAALRTAVEEQLAP